MPKRPEDQSKLKAKKIRRVAYTLLTIGAIIIIGSRTGLLDFKGINILSSGLIIAGIVLLDPFYLLYRKVSKSKTLLKSRK